MLRMSLSRVCTFLLVAVALRADNIVDEIIARVNDQIITRSDYGKGQAARSWKS